MTFRLGLFAGLRTLVVAKKVLTQEQLADFEKDYHQAKMAVVDRSEHMAAVLGRLETDLQLLCLTGVEDRLQVFRDLHFVMLEKSLLKTFDVQTICCRIM